MSKAKVYDPCIRVLNADGTFLYETKPEIAVRLVAQGAREGGNRRRVCSVILSEAQTKRELTNPETPGSLGGQAYSHKRETPQNPMNVWTLKRISPQDAHLFRLSVTENMAAA